MERGPRVEKHFTKGSTGLDGESPKSQGVENCGSQQGEEGHRLFLEDQAKWKISKKQSA